MFGLVYLPKINLRATSVSNKTISNDSISTGLGLRLSLSVVVSGLKPKRSRILSSDLIHNNGPWFEYSKILPRGEKIVLFVNG